MLPSSLPKHPRSPSIRLTTACNDLSAVIKKFNELLTNTEAQTQYYAVLTTLLRLREQLQDLESLISIHLDDIRSTSRVALAQLRHRSDAAEAVEKFTLAVESAREDLNKTIDEWMSQPKDLPAVDVGGQADKYRKVVLTVQSKLVDISADLKRSSTSLRVHWPTIMDPNAKSQNDSKLFINGIKRAWAQHLSLAEGSKIYLITPRT
jgi:hypothetical protein